MDQFPDDKFAKPLAYSRQYLMSRPEQEQKRMLEQLFLGYDQEKQILDFFYRKTESQRSFELEEIEKRRQRKLKKLEKPKEIKKDIVKEYSPYPDPSINSNVRNTTYLGGSKPNMGDKKLIDVNRNTTVPINKPNLKLINAEKNDKPNTNDIVEIPKVDSDADDELEVTPDILDHTVDIFSKFNRGLEKNQYIFVGCIEDVNYLPIAKSSPKFAYLTQELNQKYNIPLWRKIKGDGNCFYRAVVFNYIELLILEAIDALSISNFNKFIIDIYLTSFPKEHEFNKLMTLSVLVKLLTLVHLVITSPGDKKLKFNNLPFEMLYRCFNLSDKVEKTLILWLRLRIANFIVLNSSLELNGLKIIQSLPEYDFDKANSDSYEQKLIENYVDNCILKMEEYSEGIALYATAIILKVKINVLQIIEKSGTSKKVEFDFGESIEVKKEDENLDLPNFLKSNYDITLLFIDPHYDLVYTSPYTKLLECYGKLSQFLYLGKGDLRNEEYICLMNEISMNYKKVKATKLNILMNQKVSEKDAEVQLPEKSRASELNQKPKNSLQSEPQQALSSSRANPEKEKEKSDIPKKQEAPLEICSICSISTNLLVKFSDCKHFFCLRCFEFTTENLLFIQVDNCNLNLAVRKLSNLLQTDVSYLIEQYSKNISQYMKCYIDGCDSKYNCMKFWVPLYYHYFSLYSMASTEKIRPNNDGVIIKNKDLNSQITSIRNILMSYKEFKKESIIKEKICKICNKLIKHYKLHCSHTSCGNCLQFQIKNSIFEIDKNFEIVLTITCNECHLQLKLIDYFKIINFQYIFDQLDKLPKQLI